MKLTQVLGRTWVLEGSGMMGLYRMNDHHCILLDSGEQFEREELAATLDAAGLTPVGVLTSHIHVDHAVNNGWLRQRYGCQIAVSAGEAYMCSSTLALKTYLYCYSPGTLARTRKDLMCPVDCTVPQVNGVFSFCGVDFTVIPTPGHSIGHLCFITPDNVCYVGDAAFSGTTLSAKLPYGLCLAMMMDSAQALKGLNCAAYIVSHRGVHREIDDLVDGTCDLIRRRAEEIRRLVTRPMTREEIWQAVIGHFSLYSTHAFHAALLERNFQSFLDYLVDQGGLNQTAQRGLVLYQPSA